MDYKQSGVDIDAGNEVVRRIKGLARGTFTPGVLSELGSFGGLFRVGARGLEDAVLVASADGVGTKLRVAFMSGIHGTIGADLVNHCVNDILVQGAEPLFFLDYLATGRLDPDVAVQIVEGLARACRENGCALLGGETAEMPGFYADGEYDVAGFIVGAVERERLIDGRGIAPGDALIGLPSSGLHTNGYSLARTIVFDRLKLSVHDRVPELGTTVAEALLATHRSYLPIIRPLLAAPRATIKGMAHITGGGITDNLPRVLPQGTEAVIRLGLWTVPPLFQWLERSGAVPREDMLRTFNMGVGIILAVAADDADEVIGALRAAGEPAARVIGRIASAPAGVAPAVRYEVYSIVPLPSRRVTPETLIAAFVAASVAVMAVGYLIDAVGFSLHPAVLAVAAAAGGVAALLECRDSSPQPPGLVVFFGLVVMGTFAYLLWLGSPSLLPVTNGPDVVHHLLLIHVIQRTHHLVHGAALGPYLLEMVNYTPGAHILAAMVAEWLRVDALRVLLPVTAAFVAVKAGVVYTLALRIVPVRVEASLYAVAAPVLLAVPAVYVLGSFFQFYFYSQVVSETFAMAMVLTAVNWSRTGERRQLWLAAVCGVGVFLSWPVWLGPALAAVFLAILGRAAAWRARFTAAAIVVVPIAVVGILHASMHPAGAAIIGSSGAVTRPSAENIGVAFAVLALLGAMLAVRAVPAWPVVALLVVTILQAIALAALDRRAGSTSFYMPLKMVYLAVLPCAVLGALALSSAIAAVSSRLPHVGRALALVPLVVAVLLARGRIPWKPQHGPISEPSLAAGLWARGAVPPGCVDYFSRHWLTGYWLHLDVLGNPRLSDRMRAETFDLPDVVGKWIEGKGLPYAIVEDYPAVPRDARVDMVVLRDFPPAAVVQNRRPAPALGSDPESALCRGK